MTSTEIFTKEEMESLREAIKKEYKINLIAYSLLERTERQIDIILDEILKQYNKQDIRGSIYTCIKELAVNGTKANLKSVFFEKKKIPYTSAEEFKKGSERFKKVLEKSREKNFGKIIQNRGFYVKIVFDYSSEGIYINVINNCHIPKHDIDRINEKLEKSKTYESIADYYMDAFDDTEGAGMGLAMIVIILKGMEIDVENFSINIDTSGMSAEIYFPFDEINTEQAAALNQLGSI